MMAYMHQEDAMREIENGHKNIMDDMYDEETRYLDENTAIEDMYIEIHLEENSFSHLSNLDNQKDEYFRHVS